jgi:hypothetical protein
MTTLVNAPDDPTATTCGACALLGAAAKSEAAKPNDAANHLHFFIDSSPQILISFRFADTCLASELETRSMTSRCTNGVDGRRACFSLIL